MSTKKVIKRAAKALPGIFITKETVNERVKNYQKHKHPILSAAIKKDETKAAWYSLDQLEQLMREVYYLNADGLRIYFGAYDQNDLQYPGQLTVIFVPTAADEKTGDHTDIIIDDHDEYVERIAIKQRYHYDSDITKNLDTIGLCPPGCAGNDLSYPY